MSPTRRTRFTIVFLAGYNLVQNTVLNERGYVTGNLVATVFLVALGRASGVDWEEIGLHPARFRPGLRSGAWVCAGAGAAALLALSHPTTRALLLDERARPVRGVAPWKRALVRFPLGTALFEEVAFRGVLSALLGQTHGAARAELGSAGLFAAWHLIPTSRALSRNPLGESLTPLRRALALVSGSAIAGCLGLIFSEMRARSGSLVAPWLAHAGLGSISYLAGTAAWRLRGIEYLSTRS